MIFYIFIRNNFFLKNVSTGFFGFYHPYYFGVTFTGTFLQWCNYFLCHSICYLISRCTVTRFKLGLYFFFSKRSGVFFLFLVVMYREVPGTPLVFCSVHSMITWILLPFFAISQSLNSCYNTIFLCTFQCSVQSDFVDRADTICWNSQRNPTIFFWIIELLFEQVRKEFPFCSAFWVRNIISHHYFFSGYLTNSWHCLIF